MAFVSYEPNETIRGLSGEWALVDREALMKLLDDLAFAANYCPDYFCPDVAETVAAANRLLEDLQ